MKNRTTYLAATAVILALVFGVTATMNSGEYLQGSFPGAGATWSLASDSPSGSQMVSSDTLVFKASIVNTTSSDIHWKEGTRFDFTFYSPTKTFYPYSTTNGKSVILRDETGTPIGEGFLAVDTMGENKGAAWASVYIENQLAKPYTIKAGSAQNLYLEIDTEALFNTYSSVGANKLDVNMVYGPITVKGNELTY